MSNHDVRTLVALALLPHGLKQYITSFYCACCARLGNCLPLHRVSRAPTTKGICAGAHPVPRHGAWWSRVSVPLGQWRREADVHTCTHKRESIKLHVKQTQHVLLPFPIMESFLSKSTQGLATRGPVSALGVERRGQTLRSLHVGERSKTIPSQIVTPVHLVYRGPVRNPLFHLTVSTKMLWVDSKIKMLHRCQSIEDLIHLLIMDGNRDRKVICFFLSLNHLCHKITTNLLFICNYLMLSIISDSIKSCLIYFTVIFIFSVSSLIFNYRTWRMCLPTFLTSGQNKIQFDSHHYIRLYSITLFCVLSHYIILPWPTL